MTNIILWSCKVSVTVYSNQSTCQQTVTKGRKSRHSVLGYNEGQLSRIKHDVSWLSHIPVILSMQRDVDLYQLPGFWHIKRCSGSLSKWWATDIWHRRHNSAIKRSKDSEWKICTDRSCSEILTNIPRNRFSNMGKGVWTTFERTAVTTYSHIFFWNFSTKLALIH